MYDNRVRFILIKEEPLGSGSLKEFEVKQDPILDGDSYLNWNDIPKVLERGTKRVSFFTKYIEKITFVKEAKDFCLAYFDRYSPNGNLILKVEIKNPYTDVWEVDYQESINMKDYSYKDEKFEVQVLSGGLDELVDAQLSQTYDFSRTTFIDDEFTDPEDINGNKITELEYNKVVVSGRKLKNLSLLESSQDVSLTQTYTNPVSLDAEIVYSSDSFGLVNSVQNFPDISGASNFLGFGTSGQVFFSPNQVFYIESEKNKVLNITISFKGTVTSNQLPAGNNKTFTFYLADDLVYNESANTYDTTFSQMRKISEIVRVSGETAVAEFDFSEKLTVDLGEGKSIGIALEFPKIAGNGSWNVSYSKKYYSILIDEDSTFEATTHNALTIKQAFERNVEIITGNRNQFRSDYFTNGDFKDLLVQSGKMVRNIPKVNEDNEPLDQLESMETSLQDLLSIKGYLNTGYGIELHNGIQQLVVEELKHFFRTNVVVEIGEVYDYGEEAATDYQWQNGEFGNDKAGEYEEQFGIYETNAKIAYGFPTSTVKETYDGISELRSDLIAVELLRRKNFNIAPTEDTPYDKETLLIDSIIQSDGMYRPRIWQDDFEAAPKKVYDPNSTGNLRLTPFRSYERHSWYINTSLRKYPDDYVRFQSGSGFTGMITQKTSEPERAENGAIQIKDTEGARFSNKIITFTQKLTYELKKQIDGSFEENGRTIPNIYCLASYTYKSGIVQYGWILKAEIMRETKFKLIKASL